MKVGDLFAVLHLDRKGFQAGLAAAKAEAGSLISVMAKVGVGAGVAVAAIGATAAVLASNFQQAMANVQTLIGPGSESEARIAALGEDVKQMSMETGKSLGDLSTGLYEVIGTFGDSADAVGLLDVAARAGAAGMSTTQDAVRLLAALTKSYGDTSVEAAQHSADLAFQTANLGVTTFPEMAQSMGRVIPTAAALKVAQEELFAVMATLTGVTGSTDEVTTQLRGSMTAMLKPSAEMKDALAELGYTGVNAGQDIVAEHGLVGAMKMLYGTTTRSTEGVAKLWRNTNTLNAVLALTGGQSEVFEQKLAAMGDVAGVTADAFEIQQKTVAAMVDRIVASLVVLMVNLGEKLLPVLESVLTWVLDNWPTIATVFETVFAAIGQAISIVATIIGGFIDTISQLVDAFMVIVDAGAAVGEFFQSIGGSAAQSKQAWADARDAGKDAAGSWTDFLGSAAEAKNAWREQAEAAEEATSQSEEWAEAWQRASVVTEEGTGRLISGASGVGDAVGDMADDVEGATDDAATAVEDFKERALQALQELEEGARTSGDNAADAWLDPIETNLKIAEVETELGSKKLRENLKSENPEIVRDAKLRTAQLTAELIKLRNEQATQGDKQAQIAHTKALRTSQFMKDGLKSKDKEIRLLFQLWKEELDTRISQMRTAASQANIGGALAVSIASQRDMVENATRDLLSGFTEALPGSEPKDPLSPLRGITRGFRIGEIFAEGFARSMRMADLAPVARSSLTPVAAGLGAGGGGGSVSPGRTERHAHIHISGKSPSVSTARDAVKIWERMAFLDG